MDFVHDQSADGRCFRLLFTFDDCPRVCADQLLGPSISGARVVRFVHQWTQTRGLPVIPYLDNVPAMTSKAMFLLGRDVGVKLHFIQPRKPTQNPLVESFNAQFGDTCLELHCFKDPSDAQRLINERRDHYNTIRPHNSLG